MSAPDATPELRSWPLEEDPRSVALRDLELGPGYVGALAATGELERVVVLDGAAELASPVLPVTARGGNDGTR